MSHVTIQLTKKQLEALAPIMEQVVEASENGKPGAIMGNVPDTLHGIKYANFTFIQHETVKKINEVVQEQNRQDQQES